MAPSKLAILSIFLALIFSQIRADMKVPDEENERLSFPVKINELGSPDSWSSKFKAKFHDLEKTGRRLFGGNAKEQNKNEQSENGASPEEREKVIQGLTEAGDQIIQELREEGGKVIQEMLDSIIQEMSGSISSLPTEIKFLQKNGSLVEQQVRKAHARADELEKKVNELEQKLQSQRKEKEELESRTNEAEEKIDDLLSEIENIGKTNDEQETKFRKTEHALEVKVAEVEMWKAKFEATLKAKVLNEVNELEKELQSQRNEKGDLKDRVNEAEKKIDDLLSKIENVNELEKELQSQRNEKGDLKDRVNEAEKKMDDLLSKIENALEKKAQAEKWAEPLVETTKTKWIPAIKEQWVVVKDTVELHVISLSNKSIEVYEVSKTTLAPHVIKAQEVVDIYFQEAKKFGKPYVDQLTTVTKPHVDKAVIAYEKFLKSASTYHHQVQGTVKDLLKRHELTRPLATKELEWFAASALVALLIIIQFRIFSSLFCTKTKKPVPGTNHARRKAKRGHPEK